MNYKYTWEKVSLWQQYPQNRQVQLCLFVEATETHLIVPLLFQSTDISVWMVWMPEFEQGVKQYQQNCPHTLYFGNLL